MLRSDLSASISTSSRPHVLPVDFLVQGAIDWRLANCRHRVGARKGKGSTTIRASSKRTIIASTTSLPLRMRRGSRGAANRAEAVQARKEFVGVGNVAGNLRA